MDLHQHTDSIEIEVLEVDVPPDDLVIRRTGFHTVNLPLASDGVLFNAMPRFQLGYCERGSVSISMHRDTETAEVMNLRKGDLFSVPIGSPYRVENNNDGLSRLIVAIADTNDDHPVKSHPFGRSWADSASTVKGGAQDYAGFVNHDVKAHVVVYYAHEDTGVACEQSIGGIFERDLLAREFGISCDQLPTLEYSQMDALLIRTLNAEERSSSASG